jgi:hypothetical protein
MLPPEGNLFLFRLLKCSFMFCLLFRGLLMLPRVAKGGVSGVLKSPSTRKPAITSLSVSSVHLRGGVLGIRIIVV